MPNAKLQNNNGKKSIRLYQRIKNIITFIKFADENIYNYEKIINKTVSNTYSDDGLF